MLIRVLPFVLVLGCGGKKEEKVGPPFAGPLTVDLVMKSKDAVKIFDPWDKALPKLEAKLGKATKIDDKDGDHIWAVMDGEKCAYVMFSSGDGAEFGKKGLIVDTAQSPMVVEKDGPIMNRADCMEAAGAIKEPAEDPNAAGPPEDGNVPPADFEKNAKAARSKWEGKKIKVTGNVTGTGGLLVNVDGASCILKSDAPSDLIGKTITVEGTVKFQKMVSGAGVPSYDPRIEDCVIVDGGAAAGSGSAAPAAGSGSAAK